MTTSLELIESYGPPITERCIAYLLAIDAISAAEAARIVPEADRKIWREYLDRDGVRLDEIRSYDPAEDVPQGELDGIVLTGLLADRVSLYDTFIQHAGKSASDAVYEAAAMTKQIAKEHKTERRNLEDYYRLNPTGVGWI